MANQHESARSKRTDPDALPERAPMKAGPKGEQPKISRAPSSDQKKVRRLQQKTAKRPGYAPGYEAGREFGDSFISTDEAHPWNSMPHLRTRMSAAHMPEGLRAQAAGAFIAGFAQGVYDVQVEKTATVLDTTADRLQPGDSVLGPTGQTLRVKRVRNHETSKNHVYVDTDQGTTLAERGQSFKIAPHNTVQQEVPGFGIPGANSNSTPFGRDHGQGASNQVGSGTCPNCGASGSMTRRGGTYVCSRCGYHEQTGPLGNDTKGNPLTLLDSERVIRTFTSLDRPTAIASRARAVLKPLEEQ